MRKSKKLQHMEMYIHLYTYACVPVCVYAFVCVDVCVNVKRENMIYMYMLTPKR